ncbi:MAG: ankyrin repeat domain-containing protein, partial [Anaerolineaceae bacterium]|nr:ankyrin repeat domain-containing protein [Anaerolineaceae bacterium]
MRTRLLLPVLFLLLVTTAAQAQELEPAWLEVADVALRLRSGPSTDDAIITQLTPHEAVQLLQRGEQWSHIRRQDGTSGWAHNDYLLPWDKRNRPDARRRVGERRLFRVFGGQQRYADLRVVSEHSYIYSVARFADGIVPTEQDLQELGRVFDQRIYQQSLDLWGIDDPPDIGGDERIVILLAPGFDIRGKPGGWYSRRHDMPREPDPAGTGYIGLAPLPGNNPYHTFSFPNVVFVLAHEFGHLLHHHLGGTNLGSWVGESLATFTAHFLDYEHNLYEDREFRPIGASAAPSIQLNVWASDYPGYLFMIYMYERLGAEMLRDFAAHPRQGLVALDDLLAERGDSMDADDFFADWAIANYLSDVQREGGRFGYQMIKGEARRAPPGPSNRIRQLPTGIRSSTAPYSTDYYELPSPQDSAAADHLLLDFRLGAPAPQDAWLQLVHVLPDSIDVQRFRASDYRNQPFLASLGKEPERIFVAVSPFTPGRRHSVRPVHYSIALRELSSLPDNQAQVATTLNLRSTAKIADNIVGRLRPCSYVQVLQRDEQWSQVQGDAGLVGWSHNDYLFHLNAASPGVSASSCTALMRAAHDGNLATVQNLLASGADVNGQDAWGRSALHEAAFWGHERVIARLLRAGADVHLQDLGGRTPLDEVFHSADPDSIQLLLGADNDLDLSDPAIRPLMIDAAATGNNDLLGKILASNHDVNWRDADGRTALATAAANGHVETLGQLLAAGGDLKLTDRTGRTPLMVAAARGQTATLGELLRAGAEVNRQDLAGNSALTLAAANGHAMSVARLLLATDVDVHHILPDSGRNALHLAAAAGHDDAVAMLLLGDADSGARDAGGLAPLQLAEAAGHDQAAAYLRMPVSWTPVRGLKLSP